jgi:purine-binding chemotaxis protein CheW
MGGTTPAAESEGRDGRGGQFATFVVDGVWFGIEVPCVQEVLRAQPLTRVPRAAGAIEGLINLRGQIVTALDMRRRLGLRARGADGAPMNLVIRAGDGAVSLLVDEIGDVLDVEPSAFEDIPESVPAGIRSVATGVYKLEHRLLITVSAAQVLDQRRAAVA